MSTFGIFLTCISGLVVGIFLVLGVFKFKCVNHRLSKEQLIALERLVIETNAKKKQEQIESILTHTKAKTAEDILKCLTNDEINALYRDVLDPINYY